jgi:hemolysin activation/secretion protein
VGAAAVALTAAAGTTTGQLPSQRQWFLGGVRTVRGQAPGTLEGNAFWLARAEVGTRQGVFRPVAFFDVGWAGSRRALGQVQPMRGTGVGVGVLDGLLRLDVARGLYPLKGWRTDLYLQAPL